MSCVACRGGLARFGEREGYTYARCERCGTIQLDPLPSRKELEEAYAAEYVSIGHYFDDPTVCLPACRNYYVSIARALRAHGAAGQLLDYGAGWGGLTALLLAEGFNAQGVELSRKMVAYSQQRGLPVTWGELSTVKGKQFGALALSAVFEHLVEHDAWLRDANRVLEPGGLFVSLQPTAPFADLLGRMLRLGDLNRPLPRLHAVFAPPWHTVLFSLEGMRHLTERHGFKLLEVRPAPQGRQPGPVGLAQATAEKVNQVGWAVAGRRWPLLTAHVFIFQKVGEDGSAE